METQHEVPNEIFAKGQPSIFAEVLACCWRVINSSYKDLHMLQ